tara:strand:+ start:503 stop:853 length:351 start_codon:yes stop_codon:yes gene_type:complete
VASPYRVNRVRELLQRELSDVVMSLRDPRVGLVTVVDTEVSKDLRHARMFVSVIGTETEKREAQKALNRALGHIRREIARRISLRHVPEFSVVYDDTAERASRIDSLINSLGSSDE